MRWVVRAAALPILLGFQIVSSRELNASVSEFDYEKGHWIGKAEQLENGQAAACTLSLHSTKEEMIVFRLERSNRLSIGVFEVDWKKPAHQELQVLAFVDHTPIYSGPAMLIKPKFLFMALPTGSAALGALKNGSMISVSSDNVQVVFDLEGAPEAFDFLLSCLAPTRRTKLRHNIVDQGEDCADRRHKRGATSQGTMRLEW